IWAPRSDSFRLWEESIGITQTEKRSRSVRSNRRSLASASTSGSASSSTPDRWRTWISSALETGRPWLDFQKHINNLISRLVHRFLENLGVCLLDSYSTL